MPMTAHRSDHRKRAALPTLRMDMQVAPKLTMNPKKAEVRYTSFDPAATLSFAADDRIPPPRTTLVGVNVTVTTAPTRSTVPTARNARIARLTGGSADTDHDGGRVSLIAEVLCVDTGAIRVVDN